MGKDKSLGQDASQHNTGGDHEFDDGELVYCRMLPKHQQKQDRRHRQEHKKIFQWAGNRSGSGAEQQQCQHRQSDGQPTHRVYEVTVNVPEQGLMPLKCSACIHRSDEEPLQQRRDKVWAQYPKQLEQEERDRQSGRQGDLPHKGGEDSPDIAVAEQSIHEEHRTEGD